MDINLPGMSGIECVARLRKELSVAHVIMLTIYEDSERIFSGAPGRRRWLSGQGQPDEDPAASD
jgi:DNA-binding NarL/FixJ family response regulator